MIAQDKMKSRIYKINYTAASDQVLNCQPKIVILNNMSLSYYYRGKLILCSTNFTSSIPIFRTSRKFFRTSRFLVLTGPGPVNFWEIFEPLKHTLRNCMHYILLVIEVSISITFSVYVIKIYIQCVAILKCMTLKLL